MGRCHLLSAAQPEALRPHGGLWPLAGRGPHWGCGRILPPWCRAAARGPLGCRGRYRGRGQAQLCGFLRVQSCQSALEVLATNNAAECVNGRPTGICVPHAQVPQVGSCVARQPLACFEPGPTQLTHDVFTGIHFQGWGGKAVALTLTEPCESWDIFNIWQCNPQVWAGHTPDMSLPKFSGASVSCGAQRGLGEPRETGLEGLPEQGLRSGDRSGGEPGALFSRGETERDRAGAESEEEEPEEADLVEGKRGDGATFSTGFTTSHCNPRLERFLAAGTRFRCFLAGRCVATDRGTWPSKAFSRTSR